ncbi:MAG: hypothetical protein KBA75_02030 [Alphaproteobacteria bacterium]|nr:hypothetical protein [Alphaproteobacteria bacterium]
MKSSDAGRQREVLKDSMEHGRDWALAGLVQQNVAQRLASTRGANQTFTQGLGELVDVFRYDMADSLDAQSLARQANVLYEVNTSAKSGDWSFGNFMAADVAYSQMVALDRAADAREAGEAANAKPAESGAVTVSGRPDVMAQSSMGKSLITEQPMTVRPATTEPAAQSAAATSESTGKKKQLQHRRPGLGLFS